MKMETIKVLNASGIEVAGELLNEFVLPETGKRYVVYTLNEENESGMIKIYVAEKTADGSLKAIESDDEWVRLKQVLKEKARGE